MGLHVQQRIGVSTMSLVVFVPGSCWQCQQHLAVPATICSVRVCVCGYSLCVRQLLLSKPTLATTKIV